MADSDRLSGTSDALLPGAGHTPGYGINDVENSNLESILTESGKTTTSIGVRSDTMNGKENVWVVARCAITACMASFVCGLTGGFSSPTLLELENKDITVYSAQLFNPNSSYPNLFGALAPIGGMVGGLLAWPISDLLGRQAALMLGGVPFLIGWILISNAIQFTASRAGFLTFLLLGRVLTGVGTGWSIFSVSVYIAEISSTKWKGRFGICNQLLQTGGILLIYFLGINFGGHQVRYYYTALVAAGVIALFELGMLATYETPRWLFSKNRDYEGIRVLKALRGPQFHISNEIDGIKTAIRRTYSIVEQLLEFRRRSVLHPFILVLLLMFFQQFSGINVAIFYSSKIFTDAGYTPDKANLITFFAVGVVQVVATFVSILLITSVGQRKLLVCSSVGMLVSSFLLGIYFFVYSNTCDNDLNNSHCPQHIEILAILCVVVFISSFSIGWGPIPWATMSELLPNQVRSLGGSVATAMNWCFATIITLNFDAYRGKVTPEGTWWSFSFIMLLSILFVLLFLPETNGHTLEQIQAHFETGTILVKCCNCQQLKENVEREYHSKTGTYYSKNSIA